MKQSTIVPVALYRPSSHFKNFYLIGIYGMYDNMCACVRITIGQRSRLSFDLYKVITYIIYIYILCVYLFIVCVQWDWIIHVSCVGTVTKGWFMDRKKKKTENINYYSNDLYSVSERFRFINNNGDVIAYNWKHRRRR